MYLSASYDGFGSPATVGDEIPVKCKDCGYKWERKAICSGLYFTVVCSEHECNLAGKTTKDFRQQLQQSVYFEITEDGEIKVFREPVVLEVGFLKCRAALECEDVSQCRIRDSEEQPGDDVVLLHHSVLLPCLEGFP